MELLDFASKLPPTAGAAVIASVLDNAPAATTAADGTVASGAEGGAAGANGMAPAVVPIGTAPGPPAVVVAALQAPTAAGGAAGLMSWWSPLLPLLALPSVTDFRWAKGIWRSGMVAIHADVSLLCRLSACLLKRSSLLSVSRCSAKEGLASKDPILFDQILAGLCTAWPGATRLCFKGCINVASQTAGWDALRALTKLQQLELR